MVEHEIVFYLVVGIMIFSIVLYANERFLGSGLPQNVTAELSPQLAFSLQNEVLPESGILGPVEVRNFRRDDGSYLYQITASPIIKIIGEHNSNIDAIAIIRFKKQSLRAKILESTGENDHFTIGPNDGVFAPRLFVEMKSEIVPLQDLFTEYYNNDRFNSNIPVLIKSGKSAVIVNVVVNRFETVLSDSFEDLAWECRATFSLEGPCITKFTTQLTGDPNLESEREEKLNICGGEARVRLLGKPDCTTKTVSMDIEYKNGQDWEEAGERVYVSFWKDTTCTKKTSDFYQLLALCPKDRLGGEYKMNAGCLRDGPPYDAPCIGN